MSYEYKVYAVTPDEWDQAKLGTEFRGGIIVEGTCDRETEQDLLIVRYERSDG